MHNYLILSKYTPEYYWPQCKSNSLHNGTVLQEIFVNHYSVVSCLLYVMSPQNMEDHGSPKLPNLCCFVTFVTFTVFFYSYADYKPGQECPICSFIYPIAGRKSRKMNDFCNKITESKRSRIDQNIYTHAH